MAKEITWEGDHIVVTPTKRPKKITGTRFATILGLNPWSTPFEMWCAITRTYEKPFEDTIYTLAGKIIEPKQAEYMEKMYGMSITRPADIWGEDYFQKTYGDFFEDNDVFGGMWDYLLNEEDGSTSAVLEMKTTKRAEDWEDDVPEYYAMQAALYAYLLNIDHVIMVCSFLEAADYNDPDGFVPNITNTITVEFNVSERYKDFASYVQQARDWWDLHVVTGVSPAYDEKKDKEILDVLRTNSLSPNTDIEQLIAEAEVLKDKIDTVTAEVADDEKRLKKLNDLIKKYAVSQFGEGDKKVMLTGTNHTWVVSRSTSNSIDKDSMKADGVLEKYTVQTESYRMTVK